MSRSRSAFARVASNPLVYRAHTALLGRARLEAAIAPVVARVASPVDDGTVVDVGGGVAPYRSLWPPSWTYYVVDPDERVADLTDDTGTIRRLTGAAERVPLGDATADNVFMSAVSHHLDDATWEASLVEVRRLLKPDGAFLFLDGVWNPRRWVSRVGWFADGGRHPRSTETLEGDIGDVLTIESVDRLTLLHDVVIVVARGERV